MRLGNMRCAVTVISVAYDLSWVSRSKFILRCNEQPTTFDDGSNAFRLAIGDPLGIFGRRGWDDGVGRHHVGCQSRQGVDSYGRSAVNISRLQTEILGGHPHISSSRWRDSFGRALLRREVNRLSRW
jgi:hypothetical protein